MRSPDPTPLVWPDDAFNRSLVAQVRPPDWINPRPSGRYNLVVIGAGTAGLVTAAVAAGLGAKVALIERHLLGGDCLNTGCVPSKALLRAARAWAEAERGTEFGLSRREPPDRDFAAVMARMRRLRARLSPHDSAARFRELGVDLFLGDGRFSGPDKIEVEGQTLRFARAALCTGTRPAVPAVPGLTDVDYLTNENVFALTELPRRLAVLGGGPIGCELSQAFARFGSLVTLLQRSGRILPRDEPDAAAIVENSLVADGVRVVRHAQTQWIEARETGTILSYEHNGMSRDVEVDAILVAAGRAPNVENLGLDAAGVAFDLQNGVIVDDRLRTTNPRIFAAGDVCFPHRFTHVADALAQIVVRNALFPHPFGLGCARTTSLRIPWCTYTEPELAHVGLTQAEARRQGLDFQTFTVPMNEVDRAVLDSEEEGFARVLVRRGGDQILGATIVSAHAGDLIAQITLLTQVGKGLGTIASTIYPYPTQSEALKRLAHAWLRTRLTPRAQSRLSRLFAWLR
jgi:pyruvate/2-oxoglutarate dehydrogenase complex dihydrolipoamide dehydrogenase (E3) component